MAESEYLEMPWNIEDTIENLNKIREILKVIMIRENLDGKASDDVKELEFDFDRATKALEKQIPKKPEYEADGYADGELVYDYAKCPICGHDFEYGINDWGCEYCSDCGQKLNWESDEE